MQGKCLGESCGFVTESGRNIHEMTERLYHDEMVAATLKRRVGTDNRRCEAIAIAAYEKRADGRMRCLDLRVTKGETNGKCRKTNKNAIVRCGGDYEFMMNESLK